MSAYCYQIQKRVWTSQWYLPVADPAIVLSLNADSLYGTLAGDIDKHYEKHPVIIISDNEYRERQLNHFKVSKMKFAEGG